MSIIFIMDVHNDYTDNDTFYFFKVCFFLLSFIPGIWDGIQGFVELHRVKRVSSCSLNPLYEIPTKSPAAWTPPTHEEFSALRSSPFPPPAALSECLSWTDSTDVKTWVEELLGLCFHKPAKWFPSRLKFETHCSTAHCLSDNNCDSYFYVATWPSHGT